MTDINRTGKGAEIKNSTQWVIQSSISGLLEDSIEWIFWKLDYSGNNFSSAVNPIEYNNYQANTALFLQRVKSEMKSIRDIENKKSYNTTDAEIDSLTDQKIKNTILAHTSKFVALRKRVITKATSLQKKFFQDWAKISIFQQYVETLTQENLEKLALYPRKLFAEMKKIFPEIEQTEENDIFQKIFYDLETVNLNLREKNILNRMIQDWKEGNSVRESDLELALRIYNNASFSRKKELLHDLNAEFSLAFALQNKWITENEIDNLLAQTFPEIGTIDTPAERKIVRDIVLKKGNFYLTIDDISWHMDSLFDGDNRKNLAKILQKEWSHGPNITEANEDQKQWKITKEVTEQFNLKNPDGTWDYSYHQAFIDVIQRKLKNPDGKEKVPGLEKLKNNSVIAYTKDGKSRYIRIKNTGMGHDGILPLDVLNNTEAGIQVANITGAKDTTIWSEQLFELSYEQLATALQSGMDDAQVYSEDEFSALTTTDPNQVTDWKILDASQAEAPTVNQENLLIKLNEIDPEGSKYGFETGTYFTAQATEESSNGKKSEIKQSAIWKVEKIHGNFIDIQYEKGNSERNIPIHQFYEVLVSWGFKRINLIKDDDAFLSAIKSNPDRWLFENTKLDHGHMSFTEKDEKWKEHTYTIHNFVGEWDEHIRMWEIHDWMVSFGEYQGEDLEKAKKYVEKKWEEKADGFYKWRNMTYGAFIEYLKENELKASKEDKLVPHAHHEHEHGTHPHMHGSFWSRIFKAYNFHDLLKGWEMLLHSIEHALEKWSKANAAQAALRMWKFLNLPASIQAQLTADIVDGNKELIEKYTKKLQNLNWPIGRSKALHAAHNKDARPEEVVAAIYHMIQGYGQLYAEDPEMLNQKGHSGQWSDSFLYALINACWFKGDELEKMKALAYKKWGEEMSPDKCTEEGAIYGFMKIIDGKADEYPVAAALIKASGGPGGFEKAWRTEGAEQARQKGERQAGAVPNPDARLSKVIWYMKTWEYNSAVWGLKKMMGKTPSTKYRSGDFVFLVWWFTGMLSNDARQKLFAENQWSSFHACAFVRHDHLAQTYTTTVRLALGDMDDKNGTTYLKKFNDIMVHAPYGKDIEIDGKKQSFVEHMSDFWQSTYDKWLHDRLQGHNNWLFETAQNNETVRKYIGQLHNIHDQQLSWWTPSLEGNSDNSVYSQYGYAESNIFHYDPKTNTRSIANMLKKLKFHGGGIDSMKKMDDEVVGRVWEPILATLNNTLNDDASEAQKKKQFLKTRSELISYFSTEFSTTTKDWNSEKIERQIKSQPYFDQLQKAWIDPHWLFPDAYKNINFEQQDYEAWKNHRSAWNYANNTIRPNIREEITKIL